MDKVIDELIEKSQNNNKEIRNELIKLKRISPDNFNSSFLLPVSDQKGYKFGTFVGSGSYGYVYNAIDEKFNDFECVVKVMPLKNLMNKSWMEDFQEESGFLYNLNNCSRKISPKFKDAWFTKNPISWLNSDYELIVTHVGFIVMEKLPMTLRTWIKNMKFSNNENFKNDINKILEHVKNNLIYLYSKTGHVHCDVNDENIMMKGDVPLLIDFGLNSMISFDVKDEENAHLAIEKQMRKLQRNYSSYFARR